MLDPLAEAARSALAALQAHGEPPSSATSTELTTPPAEANEPDPAHPEDVSPLEAPQPAGFLSNETPSAGETAELNAPPAAPVTPEPPPLAMTSTTEAPPASFATQEISEDTAPKATTLALESAPEETPLAPAIVHPENASDEAPAPSEETQALAEAEPEAGASTEIVEDAPQPVMAAEPEPPRADFSQQAEAEQAEIESADALFEPTADLVSADTTFVEEEPPFAATPALVTQGESESEPAATEVHQTVAAESAPPVELAPPHAEVIEVTQAASAFTQPELHSPAQGAEEISLTAPEPQVQASEEHEAPALAATDAAPPPPETTDAPPLSPEPTAPGYFRAAGDPNDEPESSPPDFWRRQQDRTSRLVGSLAAAMAPGLAAFAGGARNFFAGAWQRLGGIKHPRNVREAAVWSGWAAGRLVVLLVGFFFFVTWGMPSADDLCEARNGQSITYLDRNGNVILREGAQNAPPVALAIAAALCRPSLYRDRGPPFPSSTSASISTA